MAKLPAWGCAVLIERIHRGFHCLHRGLDLRPPFVSCGIFKVDVFRKPTNPGATAFPLGLNMSRQLLNEVARELVESGHPRGWVRGHLDGWQGLVLRPDPAGRDKPRCIDAVDYIAISRDVRLTERNEPEEPVSDDVSAHPLAPEEPVVLGRPDPLYDRCLQAQESLRHPIALDWRRRAYDGILDLQRLAGL